MTARAGLMRRIALAVPAPRGPDCVRVGIDGADGAGKSTFADELAVAVSALGRPVVRISVDDFHRPRAERYRRGRDSAEGFWLDSFDYARLWTYVLHPLGPGGDRVYRYAAHDVHTDAENRAEPRTAEPRTVVVVDGLFLHRNELAGAWEFSVLLEVDAATRVHRLALRDGSPDDPDHVSLRRYLDGDRLYRAGCRPDTRADVVIDNSVLDARVLLT